MSMCGVLAPDRCVCLLFIFWGTPAQVAAHLLLMRNAQQAACVGYTGSGTLNDSAHQQRLCAVDTLKAAVTSLFGGALGSVRRSSAFMCLPSPCRNHGTAPQALVHITQLCVLSLAQYSLRLHSIVGVA